MTDPALEIVIDSSAIIAALRRAPEGPQLVTALTRVPAPLVSAATLLEIAFVAHTRAGPGGQAAASGLLDDARAVVVPVDAQLVEIALDGWRRFGKGNHPAGLNFGDCFTYGLAKHAGLPVLCVGDDFARTDVDIVDVHDLEAS